MQAGGVEVSALENRPTLNQWVSEYWNGFQTLGSSRIIHQGGIGYIPLSEIVAYMDATYMRPVDERLKFIKMIQSLDNVYVTHINENAKRKRKSEESSARRGAQRGRRTA